MVTIVSDPSRPKSNYHLALLLIPRMGRRKFSMKGKPYGRNELISEYLWIAYCQSLAPGEVPDNNMKRARKQVSSHIQVLKGFMKGHPAGESPNGSSRTLLTSTS
jgi:hypothetical protein